MAAEDPHQEAARRLARAAAPAAEALRLHPFYRGKIQTLPKVPVRDVGDFALWYTPGVAAPCKAIVADPAAVFEHTNRGNTVAIVSDGSRVLGLGDIGPLAGLPVMEGKALLFKYLGGVDAVPLCLGTRNLDELVRTVKLLEPSFGGMNLEDIQQPKCFALLDRLRAECSVPVWHDDQQGTATATLAALLNALAVTGRRLEDARIALIGAGAANVANYRLLRALGLQAAQLRVCDSRGLLHPGRRDIAEARERFADKWRICEASAAGAGGIAEALQGAEVCIAFSTPRAGTLRPEWLRGMAREPIVFACANPEPEIWPWDARDAGAAVVCTGRGDFPNQLNNSLVFPGLFRGVLDARASTVTDDMAIAAAREIARFAAGRGLGPEAVLPRMDDWDLHPRVAAATAVAAQQAGVAAIAGDYDAFLARARAITETSRRAADALFAGGFIPAPPAG